MPATLLTLRGLKKSFGGVAALQPVSLDVFQGEILGLVGENGAGKSTLINLLSGVHEPEGGEICWRGETVRFAAPRDALVAGIATIHQELESCPHLSVAENMLLGERWPRQAWGGVDWQQLHWEAARRLAAGGINLPTDVPLETLTTAQRQEVEIASALSKEARLLILDEPTASLSEPEVERLFGQLSRLRETGVTIIYVSHRLDEIFRLTNRIAVLRDGKLVATHATAEITVPRLIQEMVGRPLDQVCPHTREVEPGEPLLEVNNLACAGMFHDVTFSVRSGEVVGLAGLVGAGRSELARAIYGLYPVESGEMRLCGRRWGGNRPNEALKRGLVYLPEERKRQGLVLGHSLAESVGIGFSDLMARFGLVRQERQTERVEAIMERYDIRAADVHQPVGTLSGGNQQKALLARWLERDPQVIILDEPTRGVDVGAKAQIHAIVDRLAAAGKAVLLISSDLPEIVGMSDRVLVMNRGSLSAELSGETMTEQNVILAASGLYETESA